MNRKIIYMAISILLIGIVTAEVFDFIDIGEDKTVYPKVTEYTPIKDKIIITNIEEVIFNEQIFHKYCYITEDAKECINLSPQLLEQEITQKIRADYEREKPKAITPDNSPILNIGDSFDIKNG